MQRTKEHTFIEKFSSFILRHSPETIGLTLNNEGWVSVQEFISKANAYEGLDGVVLTHKLLNEVVQTSQKKRFSFSEDGLKIRANQGHSLEDVKIEYQPVKNVKILYHGTTIQNYDSIMNNGLMKMSRNHVHLSESEKIATEVGKRYSKGRSNLIIFEVNVKRMIEEGLIILKSENNVYLTEHVAPKYLKLKK